MTTIDKTQFGPWAMITGASSGIGREFARQIAASGINVVLVARREALLEELGRALANEFGVKSRTVVADLSQVDFLDHLAQLTDDLDIGLVVSNAGTPHPGAFLKIDRSELEKGLRLNTLAHLDIAHHFGQGLAKWRSLYGERRRRKSVCSQPRRSASHRIQALGHICDCAGAGIHRYTRARKARPYYGHHAHEADEGRAVRIRRAQGDTEKPLHDYSRVDEPDHERDHPRRCNTHNGG